MHSGWFARNNVQRVTADLGFWDAKHEASRASYGSGAAGAPVPGRGLWQHWDGGERITTTGAVCPPQPAPVSGDCVGSVQTTKIQQSCRHAQRLQHMNAQGPKSQTTVQQVEET